LIEVNLESKKSLSYCLLLISFIFLICKKDKIGPIADSKFLENKIYDSSAFYSYLNTDTSSLKTVGGGVAMVTGSFQVFKRTFVSADDTGIADEEYTGYFCFH